MDLKNADEKKTCALFGENITTDLLSGSIKKRFIKIIINKKIPAARQVFFYRLLKFNGLCGKFRRAFAAGTVDVGLKPLIGHIHLTQTLQDLLGTGVVIVGDKLL